ALRTWLRMFAEKLGSISLSTSWPSYRDHISPTVSSPTRVTTPPASSRTVSTAVCLARQSFLVFGGLPPIAQVSPVSSSTYVIAAAVTGSCAMSEIRAPPATVGLEPGGGGECLALLAAIR